MCTATYCRQGVGFGNCSVGRIVWNWGLLLRRFGYSKLRSEGLRSSCSSRNIVGMTQCVRKEWAQYVTHMGETGNENTSQTKGKKP